ncbi:MAG: hypothetical protein DRP01_00720 [Archaeoglobales archaeon]|nr:MAG: hypothetical protein DRP01_00720 [Archaeoglobales archaeon]
MRKGRVLDFGKIVDILVRRGMWKVATDIVNDVVRLGYHEATEYLLYHQDELDKFKGLRELYILIRRFPELKIYLSDEIADRII